MLQQLSNSLIQILNADQKTVGAGFLISPRHALTCAHVIERCGATRGDLVQIQFYRGHQPARAAVLPEGWSPVADDDIAVLSLEDALPGSGYLTLGAAASSERHPFQTIGFPRSAQAVARIAGGEIQGLVSFANGRKRLQITGDKLDHGMSGSPVLDLQSALVVGMITWGEDHKYHRTGYAIPAETIKEKIAQVSSFQVEATCPFQGLDAFDEQSAEFYFGRSGLVNELLRKLKKNSRFLAILGPSGSGKSSLVKAGLFPALRKGKLFETDHVFIFPTRPGRTPLNCLNELSLHGAVGFLNIAREWTNAHPANSQLVIFVDQFEEFYLSMAGNSEQEQFIAQLEELLEANISLTLIIAFRNDFYSRFVETAPGLARWLEKGCFANISAQVAPEELLEMIQGPAKAAGLVYENGLDTIILDEVIQAGHSKHEKANASVLPLLQFALTQLWRKRKNSMLLRAEYLEMERVSGGLSKWAYDVYSNFPPPQKIIARKVLTGLVHLGDEQQGVQDSRIICPKVEITRNQVEIETVVNQLANARLLTTSYDPITKQPVVELIHDTLIWRWDDLQQWLKEDRIHIRNHAKLKELGGEWRREHKPTDSYLIRGRQLTIFLDWAERNPDRVTPEEQEYLDFCAKQEIIEKAEKEKLKRTVAEITHRLANQFGGITVFVERALRFARERDISPDDREKFVLNLIETKENLDRVQTTLGNLAWMTNEEAISSGFSSENFEKSRNLAGQISQIVQRYLPEAKQKDVELYVDRDSLSQLDYRVYIDPSSFNLAMANIISNAVKYSHGSTRIIINSELTQKFANINTTNQGIPLRPEEAERIFEAGYRTGDAGRHAVGTGIGLYVARQIIQNHHGKIFATSKELPGNKHLTTFTIQLPLDGSKYLLED